MSAVLTVRGLALSRDQRDVLRDVTFDVHPGEICALMGESGAGKSTVLRAIAALEPFRAGRIAVGDAELVPGPIPPESRLRGLRRRIGFFFQAASLFEHLTAIENVTLAPVHALGWTPERATAVARDLLESLGVAGRMDAYPSQLSGGEAQRVAIARALAPDPAVLLMDEPTAALDPARRSALGDTLRALAAGGRALLVATHDADFAREFTDPVLMMDAGRVLEAARGE